MKIIAKNKRAFYDYEILEKYLAGIELLGSEIKSIRDGHVHLQGSFVSLRSGEAFWKNGYIKHWKFAGDSVPDELRDRRLLLHKKQIVSLEKELAGSRTTIIPLALGLERGHAKLEIALARGKAKYDKRETIKKRDLDREMKQKIRLR